MKRLKKILFITILSIFIILTICVCLGLTQNIDNKVSNLIKQIRNENLTTMLTVITNFGGIINVFIITITSTIILFLAKKRKFGIAITLNVIISSITYIIVKNIIQRPRPLAEESLIMETGYSFPSGHSTNNMAFYTLAIYLVYKNVKNKSIRNLLCIALAIIPLLIAFSRIYLGVHYFSDIIAGLCLGALCVMTFIHFYAHET